MYSLWNVRLRDDLLPDTRLRLLRVRSPYSLLPSRAGLLRLNLLCGGSDLHHRGLYLPARHHCLRYRGYTRVLHRWPVLRERRLHHHLRHRPELHQRHLRIRRHQLSNGHLPEQCALRCLLGA